MQYRPMIVRVSSSAVRGLFVLLAVLLAVALGYSGVRNTIAQYEVAQATFSGYERAVRLEPDDAGIWYLLGRYWQYNLDSPDVHQAVADYQKSLSFDPHSADTWLDLATAHESEGDIAAAATAFLQAQQAYPQSPDVAWRYGNFLLRRGEQDAAFAQIKHAVRLNPKLASGAFALSLRFQPDINVILDRALPASPDALLNVIDSFAQQKRTDQALIVWSRLATLVPHVPVSASYPLIETLLQKYQIADAQRVWNDALGFAGIVQPEDVPGSLIWDGGFESDVQGGGFAWRFPAAPGAVQIALDEREKHSGKRSLRLTFTGLDNVELRDLCQFVAVRPSTSFLFSAWIRTDAISTDQGVRFGLTSLADAGASVVWTDDVRGTQPWTRMSFAWSSAPNVHAVRVCVNRLPSTKFDNKIQGVAWIDDVALVPQAAESTAR